MAIFPADITEADLLEREAMLAAAGLTPEQAEAWGWLVDKEPS